MDTKKPTLEELPGRAGRGPGRGGGEMSKELMAECLTEAAHLFGWTWEAFLANSMDSPQGSLYIQPIATIAGALYQERCRQADAESPKSWAASTMHKPLCPDCSLVWEEGHLCPAAGSRGTARCPPDS